jgi:cephalosporin hydroxylase
MEAHPSSPIPGRRTDLTGTRPGGLTRWAVKLANWRVDLLRRPRPFTTGIADLREIAERARERSDISDHLVPLFVAAMTARPRLIVELGVRGGASTFVLERVARLSGAALVSVDIDDCSRASAWKQWLFVQSDDIPFAQAFPGWCADRGLRPRIDFLFVDTSHLFEHTVAEIDHWFPFLAEPATVAFHDTNIQPVYRRRDGSRGIGWHRQRGVMTAIERYFGTAFDERSNFVELQKGWLINHDPLCGGFTVLTRLQAAGHEAKPGN